MVLTAAARTKRLAACVVVLALAGCGPAGAEPSPDRMQLAFELMTHTGSFHAGQAALDAAEHRLTGACMEKQGLVYTSETGPVDTRTDEEREIDLDNRRARGYGLSESLAQADGTDSTVEYPSELDRYVAQLPERERKAYRQALFGDERDYQAIQIPHGGKTSFPGVGCVAEARAQLFGDVVSWARVAYIPQSFHAVLTRRASDDPGYATAMDEWRACLAARGYSFTTPDEAVDDVTKAYKRTGNTPETRQDEIAVAVADGECAREAHVPSRVLDLKRKYLHVLSNQERLALGAVADAWSDAVDVAKGR